MKKTSKVLTEMEALQAAFAKVNIREAVAPIVRGKIVEDEDTYNKVQQLLDCPEMEHAHKFLLDIDFDDLTPEIVQKVDDIFQLAVSQGFLKSAIEANDEEAEDAGEEAADIAQDQPQISDNSGGFEKESIPDPSEAAAKDSINADASNFCSCAFVLFYSAMKDGKVKTGECYSNATTLDNAKLDAVQKLKKLGFTAIDILAAEECDPSARGCDSRQPDAFGAKSFGSIENETLDTSAPLPIPEAKTEKKPDNAKSDEEKAEKEEKEEKEEPEEEKPEEKAEEEPEEEEEEEKEEPEEKDDGKEMSRTEKLEMFKSYLNEFKNLLQKMKAETYAEMSLVDRAKFYDEMSKIWKGKPDPSSFMTDDNVKQIEHMRIKIAK